MNLIEERIFEEDNLHMMEDPTEEEVKRLVHLLPKDKSPEIATVEVLLCFWPIMKPVCIVLIQAF